MVKISQKCGCFHFRYRVIRSFFAAAVAGIGLIGAAGAMKAHAEDVVVRAAHPSSDSFHPGGPLRVAAVPRAMSATKAAGAAPTGASANLGSEKTANPASAVRMERAAPATTAVPAASSRSELALRAPAAGAPLGDAKIGTIALINPRSLQRDAAALAPANPAGSVKMAKGAVRLASLAPAHPVGSAATKSDGKMGFVGVLDRPAPTKARVAASPAIKLAAVDGAVGNPAATAVPIIQPGHHQSHRGHRHR